MEPVPATAAYEDFAKIQLRVGKILEVSAHANADRLYVLKVDLGGEVRQLVAGIRAHYTPEQLVGRQVAVVANLASAVIRGVESQGMIIAADDGAAVAFLTPEKTVKEGAKIK